MSELGLVKLCCIVMKALVLMFKKKKIHRLEALQVVQEHMNHFTAPSFFSSFLPLESSPFFFFEDISLPLPGLPEPIGDVGDPEWR